MGVGYSLRGDGTADGWNGIVQPFGDRIFHPFENPSKPVSPINQFVTTTESVVCRRTEPALGDTAQFMFIIIFCQRINVV
ncbi:hypothetical protein [Halomicrobium katesii]|uniref:hypothetical protein n=1 Tax=Halomicrobium katesii TaxID=437163 RepID=UPI000380EFCB|nr:hypothetical protein [Halomicrobium katesii]